MKKLSLVLLLFVVACTEANRKTVLSTIIGGLVGGGIGAIAGHQSNHDGEGIAIGAAAGAGIGALVGEALSNNSQPKYADNSFESQDRAFYPTQNYQTQESYYGNNDFIQNNKLNSTQYSYNSNVDQKVSGYFGAINGGTYSDYDSNLMNYVNTGQARGYLGALNADSRVADNNISQNLTKGVYGNNNYAGGSYAGRSYVGAGNAGGIPSVVNAQNVEYPKASYGWNNARLNQDSNITNNVSNVSLNNNTTYSQYSDNDDCEKAKAEVSSANNTEVLADKLFYFRKALRLCPESADYHNGLGEVYLILNRKDDAIFEFKEALRLNPAFYTAKKNLNMVNNRY